MERNAAISIMILFSETSVENHLFHFINTNNKKNPDNIGRISLSYLNNIFSFSIVQFFYYIEYHILNQK